MSLVAKTFAHQNQSQNVSFIFLKQSKSWVEQQDKLNFACYLLRAGLLLGLFFDPADGGYEFLRNVS
jgi:hypothetical protein